MTIYRIFATDEQIKKNEICTGYDFKVDLKDFDKYKTNYSKFRDDYLEKYREMTGNTSNVSLGLALGKIWTFRNFKKGDYVIVVSLSDNTKITLVQITGEYIFEGQSDWCHVQRTKKVEDIQRNDLTEDFKKVLGNRQSIIAIPEKYYGEIPLISKFKEKNIGSANIEAEALEKALKEIIDKKLDISFKLSSLLLLLIGGITFFSHEKGMEWSFPLLLWIPICSALWNMTIIISKVDERIKHYIDGKKD